MDIVNLFPFLKMPEMQGGVSLPRITREYESVNVPGLYFTGALSHSKDKGRSSGGFIHG